MPQTEFERNDGLDDLSSDDLERVAFGDDSAAGRSTPPASTRSRSASARATKFCHACGETIDERAEICPKCGVRQPGAHQSFSPGASGEKNRMVAALLAFFLGGIGGHRFYLGQTGTGIMMFIFCWTFIPALIALIDLIRYLSMSDQKFAQLYG